MNIEDIKIRKRKLESDILTLLESFRTETGVAVMSVDVRLVNVAGLGSVRSEELVISEVKVRVEIG